MSRMPLRSDFGQQCPCGSGAVYEVCCGPLHHGELQAETAEQLMRARYAAYARGDADYLFRTWHGRTRPTDVTADDDVVWKGLDVTDVVAGGIDDERGEVEFTARYDDGMMRERSRFERRAGWWVYVEGDVR